MTRPAAAALALSFMMVRVLYALPAPWHDSHDTPSATVMVCVSLNFRPNAVQWHFRHFGFLASSPFSAAIALACGPSAHFLYWSPVGGLLWHILHFATPIY